MASDKKFGTEKDIAKQFTAAHAEIGVLIANITAIGNKLHAEQLVIEEASEARRRIVETENYNHQQARQAELDRQKQEDIERSRLFEQQKSTILAAARKITIMLGIPSLNATDMLANDETIASAIGSKIAAATEDGYKAGAASVAAKYEAQKKIDIAEAKEAKSLLEHENKTLKERVAALEKQNVDLLTRYNDLVTQTNENARSAFNAAAGITNRANETVSTAVGAQQGFQRK